MQTTGWRKVWQRCFVAIVQIGQRKFYCLRNYYLSPLYFWHRSCLSNSSYMAPDVASPGSKHNLQLRVSYAMFIPIVWLRNTVESVAQMKSNGVRVCTRLSLFALDKLCRHSLELSPSSTPSTSLVFPPGPATSSTGFLFYLASVVSFRPNGSQCVSYTLISY